MWELRAEAQFHAAHKLNDYVGKCSNLHGHTWRVVVWVRVEALASNGIGVDFGILKKMLNDILPDHAYLNELFQFNPTAENLSRHIHEQMGLDGRLAGGWVVRVEVWETDKNCAVYYADM